MAAKVWRELFDAMADAYHAGRPEWIETTREMYHNQLEVLPPVAWTGYAFLRGEAWDSTHDGTPIYAAFRDRDGIYEARYMTEATFEGMFAAP